MISRTTERILGWIRLCQKVIRNLHSQSPAVGGEIKRKGRGKKGKK